MNAICRVPLALFALRLYRFLLVYQCRFSVRFFFSSSFFLGGLLRHFLDELSKWLALPSIGVFTFLLGTVSFNADFLNVRFLRLSATLIFTEFDVTHVSIISSDIFFLDFSRSLSIYRMFHYPLSSQNFGNSLSPWSFSVLLGFLAS